MGRPPSAGGAANTKMGKVKASPYSVADASGSQPVSKPSNLPVYIGLVAFGVGFIMLMRARSGDVRTGPLVVLTQSAAPDQSTIDNLTASILAISGQVHVPSPNPTGGTSTPITNSGA